MTNAATTITIHDPEGNEFEMTWTDDVSDGASEAWCEFCEEDVTGAWFNDDGAALFVLCEDCATSQQ